MFDRERFQPARASVIDLNPQEGRYSPVGGKGKPVQQFFVPFNQVEPCREFTVRLLQKKRSGEGRRGRRGSAARRFSFVFQIAGTSTGLWRKSDVDLLRTTEKMVLRLWFYKTEQPIAVPRTRGIRLFGG